MNPPTRQHAHTRGSGNIVVQIAGDGNTLNWQPQLPALWLRTFEGPAYAQVQTVAPGGDRQPGYTATGKAEADLLSPFTRSLTLRGREGVQAELRNWRDGPARVSVQVMVGGGGRGKTRLALELCAEARERGWLAGFVDAAEMRRFHEQGSLANWGWPKPTLVVIDYAAAKAEAIGHWLRELTHHAALNDAGHPPLRLLLLERHGEPGTPWWASAFGDGGADARAVRRMLAPGAPIRLGVLGDPAARAAVFSEAYRLARGTDPPPFAGLDRVLVEQSLGGEPLFLAMAGLLATRDGMDAALGRTPDELAIRLAEDELDRILKVWKGRGLPESPEKRPHAHFAALATLCEGLTEAAAHAAIERECAALHLPPTQGTEPIRAALHQALPGEDGGIAPVLPDILGEALMLVAWGDRPQGLDALRRALPEHGEAATRVILRACQDFLIRGHRAPLAWLKVVRDGITDLGGLMRLANMMPQQTVELRESALEISQQIADFTARQVKDDTSRRSMSQKASSSLDLSSRLSALGQWEPALAAIKQAVALYRVLATQHPDDFAFQLAGSLNNLSVRLSNLRQSEAALEAIEEAVALRRALAEQNPGAFTSDLAGSLSNLSVHLFSLGRQELALAAIKEAVALYRALASLRPDTFTPELAGSLNNLSVQFSILNRREAALEAIEEAVALRRTLAMQRPDAFTPDLAGSLSNLSNHLSGLGRWEEALATSKEAVSIYHVLAAQRPDAFAPDLAMSLGVYGQVLDKKYAPAAAAAFAEGIRVLYSSFFASPLAFENLMSELGSSYLAACKTASLTPDEALLAPIAAVLAKLRTTQPPS